MTKARAQSAGAIGASLPRPGARRLVAGRGRYTDDHARPGVLHAAFLRSPFANGRITAIDIAEASHLPGVVRILLAADIDPVCTPMETRLDHVPTHISPPQHPLARDHVRFQGEPVALVLARSRAEAEDAAELIELDIDPLPAIASIAAATAPGASSANGGVADNVALRMPFDATSEAAPKADGPTIAQSFRFARITGVSLEPRSILAEWNPGDASLEVVQSHQSPHLAATIYATHLGIAETAVRVLAPDVGGAFGLKMHIYPEDLAVVAASRLLGRPVKHIADRMESLLADAHAREGEIDAKLTVNKDGAPAHFEVHVRSAIGAYSIYPRSSLGDPIQALTMTGAPYKLGRLSGSAAAFYQNKAPSGPIRGVGQPLACTVTEVMIDHAARAIGEDPANYRRRAYLGESDLPGTTLGGLELGQLSLLGCHDTILERMEYRGLRAEQALLRADGVHRGIGLAAFVEQTAVGANLYGPAGLPITAQDTCILRLEADGGLRAEVGCTDQGQGTLAGIAQIVADAVGADPAAVKVVAGDSAGAYGGGAWASRGLAIAGEAAHAAGLALKAEILRLSGAILQMPADDLAISDGAIRDANDARMSLAEIARIAHYRQDHLPPDMLPQLTQSRAYIPRAFPYAMANGIQASHLEVDTGTGAIRLLGHWVVEDCGRIVNPLLVDEQLRGGIVHGLGNALFEAAIYDEDGQMQTATLADYLVPMAAEMPEIDIAHLETPQADSALGLKGAGEAGTVGAAAAVWCALNDALAPFGAAVTEQPFTPEVVLRAIGSVSSDLV